MNYNVSFTLAFNINNATKLSLLVWNSRGFPTGLRRLNEWPLCVASNCFYRRRRGHIGGMGSFCLRAQFWHALWDDTSGWQHSCIRHSRTAFPGEPSPCEAVDHTSFLLWTYNFHSCTVETLSHALWWGEPPADPVTRTLFYRTYKHCSACRGPVWYASSNCSFVLPHSHIDCTETSLLCAQSAGAVPGPRRWWICTGTFCIYSRDRRVIR